DDSDASVTEAIAAATAATYLDQKANRGREETTTAYPMIRDDINTTAAGMATRPSPSRHPSLGPRRVSNRVEDDEGDESGQDEYSTPVKVVRPRSSSPIDKVPE